MSHTNHSPPYNNQQDDDMYPDFNHHHHYPFDRLASDSAAEGRTVLYPSQLHPHPLFTRQGNAAGPSSIQNRSLELHHHHNNAVYGSPSPFVTQQQSCWPPTYSHHQQTYSHHPPPPPPYPSPSPFPAPRLSPPPIQQASFKTPQANLRSDQNNPSTLSRLTLAGSLDPSTGIFYRTPEHPRLRTAQACEKCRTRKAKCSGEHPTCKRCLNRGLVCEYAKEGRVRGPNKAKSKSSSNTTIGTDSSSSNTTPGKIRHHHHVVHARIGGPHSPTVSEEFMYPPPTPSFVRQHLYATSGNEFARDDSSPHTSVSGGTSTINSPLTPASASSFVISPSSASAAPRMSSMKMEDLEMSCVDPIARTSSRNGLMEPVWLNHVTQLDSRYHPQQDHHSIQTIDNEMSTQMMGSSSSLFVENGQGGDSQHQNDFHHRQSHSTQHHYAAMDLQMC